MVVFGIKYLIIGIEIDKKHCQKGKLNMDFFDYSIENQFDTIIGNPPYVKHNSIDVQTQKN